KAPALVMKTWKKPPTQNFFGRFPIISRQLLLPLIREFPWHCMTRKLAAHTVDWLQPWLEQPRTPRADWPSHRKRPKAPDACYHHCAPSADSYFPVFALLSSAA